MTFTFIVLTVLAFNVVTFANAGRDDEEILSLMSAYYDPMSKRNFPISAIENIVRQKQENVSNVEKYETKLLIREKKKIPRISFRSNGCTCQNLLCGCCLGINLNRLNFSREGCMNFTYDPDEFAVGMNMLFNGNSVFSNSFSAKNPPPLCVPIPIPYIPIGVEACAKVFDVYTPGNNLHLCFDFETRVQQATVLVLHFNCMRFGADGVALLKPSDGGGLPQPTPIGVEIGTDSDIYDDITEVKDN